MCDQHPRTMFTTAVVVSIRSERLTTAASALSSLSTTLRVSLVLLESRDGLRTTIPACSVYAASMARLRPSLVKLSLPELIFLSNEEEFLIKELQTRLRYCASGFRGSSARTVRFITADLS